MRVSDSLARRWLAVAYLAVVLVSTWQRGIVSRDHTTFAIFRQSWTHLISHQDLYASYPDEQGAAHDDLFKYSPTAAVFFAPLSTVPFTIALFGWNLLNAAAIFIALGRFLSPRQANIARALLLPEVLVAVQSSSSNALVAGLMLFSLNAILAAKRFRASAAIIAGASIKIFPLAALAMVLTRRDRMRYVVPVLVCALAALALPLAFVPASDIAAQYKSWHALELRDAADVAFGMSFIRAMRNAWAAAPENWVFQLYGIVLVLLPLAQRTRWNERDFQRLFACSLMLFVVLFNHQAERQSMIIAAAGCVIWFATRPLSVPLMSCYIVALSGASVIPYAILWIVLQNELLGELPQRAIVGTQAAIRKAWSDVRVRHCRSCNVAMAPGIFSCPDCHSRVMPWYAYSTPQLLLRFVVFISLADEVTMGHLIFRWNLWDLAR